MNSKIRGCGVALVTPFHNDGSIDFKSLGKIIEHLIKNGINYIVTLGTTGESSTINKEEKQAIIHFIVETVNGRIPIIAGIGGNNTQDVINNLLTMNLEGVDAILSVCPYYNKPRQKGIYLHYKTIAAATSLPIIIYNIPGRSGINIEAETTLELARDCKNIIGIKEASDNITQAMKIIRNKPKDFLVISGDDMLTLPLLSLGADGVISVVGNAYPKEFSEMVNFALAGNILKAKELHYKLMGIMELLIADGNPAGIKAVLENMKLCQNYFRLPLTAVSEETYQKISHFVKSNGDII